MEAYLQSLKGQQYLRTSATEGVEASLHLPLALNIGPCVAVGTEDLSANAIQNEQ